MTNLESFRAQIEQAAKEHGIVMRWQWLDDNSSVAKLIYDSRQYLITNYGEDGFDIYKLDTSATIGRTVESVLRGY